MVELKYVAGYPNKHEEVDLHFIGKLVAHFYGNGECNERADDFAKCEW